MYKSLEETAAGKQGDTRGFDVTRIFTIKTAEELAETTWLDGTFKLLDVGPAERARMAADDWCAWYFTKRYHVYLTVGNSLVAALDDAEGNFA